MILYINDIKITIKKEGCTVQESKYNGIFSTTDNIDLKTVKGKLLLLFPEEGNTRLFFDKLEADKCEIDEVKVVTKHPKIFFKKVFEDHKTVKAGGGIVSNSKGELLMIFRNGIWDFPKGKLDKGESIKECSLREVEEECGVTMSLGKRICKTRHTYKGSKGNVMKVTYWYEMTLIDDSKMKPQEDEGIEKAEWKSDKEASFLLKDSYASLRLLMDKYYKLKGTNSLISLPNL